MSAAGRYVATVAILTAVACGPWWLLHWIGAS